MGAESRIRVARVYDDPGPDDGQRVLVDRLWPRGFRKDDPRVGTWFKDVAPSKELREWYDHQPERFDEFATRYREELQGSEALDELRRLTKSGVVTLVDRHPPRGRQSCRGVGNAAARALISSRGAPTGYHRRGPARR
jgi:uncharacterized protein YeaO (DUF488 family)